MAGEEQALGPGELPPRAGEEGPGGEGGGEVSRRDFLVTVTGAVAGAGVVAACWPFVDSMNPSRAVLARATTEASLAGIPPGEVKTVAWQGKPVFVFHRTEEQIRKARASQGKIDPEPDEVRVKDPRWLVVIGICTHLGCVPNRTEDGWFCPCHGSRYDLSGRVVKGPAPRNLDIPPYRFAAEDRLLIGKADPAQQCLPRDYTDCVFRPVGQGGAGGGGAAGRGGQQEEG